MPPVTPDRVSLPDRYRVVRHLANGGMASVWEAHDELLGRDVAVKLLAAHLGEDERARKRFQREARAAAGLSSRRTTRASCTGTSSRPTCCSTTTTGSPWPTSGSPAWPGRTS
jgi:serine/threonine protein kinase